MELKTQKEFNPLPVGDALEEAYQYEAERNLEEMSDIGRGARRGLNQLQATLFGATAIGGQLLGADGVKDWGIRGYKRNVREASLYPREVTLEGLLERPSVGRAFTFGVETLGELAPSMAEAAVGDRCRCSCRFRNRSRTRNRCGRSRRGSTQAHGASKSHQKTRPAELIEKGAGQGCHEKGHSGTRRGPRDQARLSDRGGKGGHRRGGGSHGGRR